MQKNKVAVYVPAGAKTNVDPKPLDSPKTKYEHRRWKLHIDKVKEVVGGIYGRSKDRYT